MGINTKITQMRALLFIIILFLLESCTYEQSSADSEPDVFLVLLGTVQDGGYPQLGCTKSCCMSVWNGEVEPEKVVSLGLVDKPNNKVYLFDATPDFREQLNSLLGYLPNGNINSVGGIFLTHAHIGHYTGLMHLGREAMGAKNVPVYVMPKMARFLTKNGPWSQLVDLNNINIITQKADSSISLSENLSVTPLLVPHRDEFSETVGYKIKVDDKLTLYIPDIDKWHKWEHNIVSLVKEVDYAFLDATFYNKNELPGRDMSEIPHPFVPETMALLAESTSAKNKVIFIHFNHTNALLHDGLEYKEVDDKGFSIGRAGMILSLD
jgi:pyrroloquinoline quinone biosynthesis protein B